jgi:hypothetical protein
MQPDNARVAPWHIRHRSELARALTAGQDAPPPPGSNRAATKAPMARTKQASGNTGRLILCCPLAQSLYPLNLIEPLCMALPISHLPITMLSKDLMFNCAVRCAGS